MVFNIEAPQFTLNRLGVNPQQFLQTVATTITSPSFVQSFTAASNGETRVLSTTAHIPPITMIAFQTALTHPPFQASSSCATAA